MTRREVSTIRELWHDRSGTWLWAILVIVVPVVGLTIAAFWVMPLLVDANGPPSKHTRPPNTSISNVICAYLRMPYTNPPSVDTNATADDRKEHDRLVQELETRRTADMTEADVIGAKLSHAILTDEILTDDQAK
ncbi:MAG TPA: hypothetical protein VGP26_13215 [Actinophytocola sp.]|jgi:hypothetical protein|nr:hypothetical protein [Actinophytocola sp.]